MINVREARPADAAAIARVHVETWRTTYAGILPDAYLAGLSAAEREQVWRRVLVSDPDGEPGTEGHAPRPPVILVAEDPEEGVVGFAAAGPPRQTPGFDAEVYAIYVLQPHQGRGAGLQLTREAVARLVAEGMRSLVVWVLADNPACGFYEALGGRLVGTRMTEIGGTAYLTNAYGWQDMRALAAPG